MKENYKTLCRMWNFCGLLSEHWKTIKDETTLLTCLLIVNDNTKRQPARKRYKFIGNEIKL